MHPDIEAYIEQAPVESREKLHEMYDLIRAAAPEASERISYQMPTFFQGRNLVHFAAMKQHIGFYPGGEAVAVFADRLTGYETSKGTIRLPLDQSIDHQLITDIVRWRVEQESARTKR